MKKLVLTLIVALGFCGLVSAQDYESHWPDFYGPDYDFQTPFVAAIQIDGQIITAEYEGWDALEIAFFVGDVCRGSGSDFPLAVPFTYYLFNGYVEEYGDPFPVIDGAALYYNAEGEAVTVKVYDHLRGIEYTDCVVTLEGDPYTILTGADNDQGWYDPENPIMLNLTTPSTTQTFTKDIAGYGDSEGGYYLIASPITEEVTPDDDNGFITTAYDLYAFDQNPSDGLEWRNYEDPETGGFTIVNGKGYLYASQNDTQLTFTGTPVDGDGTVIALDYTEGAQFAGWNLVGNPFTVNAYPDKAFYVMNEEGTDLTVVNRQYIEPMEGAFVCAQGEGEFVTISLTAPESKSGSLALNLTQGRGVVDRAVVRFGHGSLPKFQLNPNHTKVYIPQDDKDYAVVSAEAMGELPVNFKAEKNGSYSLSFTSQEVGFSYLHLIDNMTGNDVNLLETPSYTFNATTTDYASRFRLVFATDSSADGDSFSFVNAAGNLCIFGIEGEATVQVVDVLGHVLSSETFSGSYEKSLNAAPGVYMVRLIQGNDMKVQKMVVK